MSMEKHYTAILQELGEDPAREGLADTPARAAKAMRHLCRGYGQNLDEIVNGALFTSNTREIVLVKNIELYSLCEHHMLPFIGKAHVAYLPNGKVLGLSRSPASSKCTRAACRSRKTSAARSPRPCSR